MRETEDSMKEIYYTSTRDNTIRVKACEAILKGLSADGGLFVPTSIPSLDKSMEELSGMSYAETAYEVMKLFFTDFSEEELKDCIRHAYDDKFDNDLIAPMVEADGAFYLELFHGPTIAFKDMALSILPHLMTTAAKKNNIKNDIVILTATSGDTGKAALSGFSDVKGTKIIVFYPKNGVSFIQERQMVTQKGDNTFVVGIHGNFDDAQTGVKNIFADEEFAGELAKNGYQFSSANSINIGRLIPQVVYYVYSYACLLREGKIANGENINVVVPTGNFGNILAAYFAKNMGVPIRKLICASNDNKVLYDFFKTGEYNKNREFLLTCSPSMDILISSNLERLIYLTADEDSERNKKLMEQLRQTGNYCVTQQMRDKMNDFCAGYASEKDTMLMIHDLYEKTGYVLDTHTAVAAAVYNQYRTQTQDETKTVIVSTASPFKFTGSVMEAIEGKKETESDFELIDRLSQIANVAVPPAIKEIRTASVVHDHVCEKDDMKNIIREFLKM